MATMAASIPMEAKIPDAKTLSRVRADRRAGKKASTQAGEFVKDEMDALKRGSAHIKSRKQAIAVGLSEARRHGVSIPGPKR
jgi:Family of unknown function (DUF6496)